MNVKSSPFIPSAIPRIICNKCTLWTKEDTVKNSFLYILSEYALTRYKNHSMLEPSPVRQPYIFEAGIIERVSQVMDDANKWDFNTGKISKFNIQWRYRNTRSPFFFFLEVVKISLIKTEIQELSTSDNGKSCIRN